MMVKMPLSVRCSILSLVFVLGAACSLEEKAPRAIRAHSLNQEGIAHAPGLRRAERYCQSCHGLGLVGGTENQASCYTCHGQTWEKTEASLAFAPADHTVERGGFLHHPQLLSPNGTCQNCHGKQLEGDLSMGTPPCLLCHDQLWP